METALKETLLDFLKTNARASVEDIAKAINATPQEVAAQIDAWERDGTILGYQTVFDPEKLPRTSCVEAVIEVKITPERDGGFDRLASRISKFEEVRNCYLMSGGYDLLIVVQGDTLQAVARFVAEKLSTIKGVLSTATHFRLKSYKENGLLLQREPKPERLAVTP